MNKLVSKNPILRFKEGRKIVKALSGTKVIATVGGRQFETTIEQARRNGWEYFIPGKQAEFNRNYPYDKYSTKYRTPTPYFPAFIQDARFGGYPFGWNDTESGLVVDLEDGNLAWLPKKVTVPYVPTQRFQSNSSTQNVNTQNILPKTDKKPLTQNKFNLLNNNSGSQKFAKGKSKKTSVTPSVFAGYRIGRTGGLEYNINDDDIQLLIGTGQFTKSDFTNARATLQALNRYFANSGLGSVTEDGYWGDLSRTALAFALSKSKGLTPLNNETTVVKTPIVPTYTPSTTPINLEVANLKLNVNVPQQTYDRTGIREYLRSKGLNPYSFSGALRRALRMVMNGQGTDDDKLLVKGMNIFKQGGQLISRNPIKRFKLGGVLKFQNDGNLPTAPKAEDRFKNGVKDSVAYLGVPGKDNSYFGESIKRVTTPDNAAILRQILFRYYPHDNDTIYTEVPEHTKRLSIFPQVNIIPRKGFSFAQTPEYETLKRRFNTAWNLAK